MKDLFIERPGLHKNCETLLFVCANIQSNETVLIVSDWNTEILGNLLQKFGKSNGIHTVHQVITPFSFHGQEPPEHVGKEMMEHAVVFCLTERSMAHSQACIYSLGSGTKILSLPDFSLELLSGASLLADFKGLTGTAQKLAGTLTNGSARRDFERHNRGVNVVISTVDLNDELLFRAGKVSNPGPDRMLSSKLQTTQLLCPQDAPQQAFGFRFLAAQRSGSRYSVRIWLVEHVFALAPSFAKVGRGSGRSGLLRRTETR